MQQEESGITVIIALEEQVKNYKHKKSPVKIVQHSPSLQFVPGETVCCPTSVTQTRESSSLPVPNIFYQWLFYLLVIEHM